MYRYIYLQEFKYNYKNHLTQKKKNFLRALLKVQRKNDIMRWISSQKHNYFQIWKTNIFFSIPSIFWYSFLYHAQKNLKHTGQSKYLIAIRIHKRRKLSRMFQQKLLLLDCFIVAERKKIKIIKTIKEENYRLIDLECRWAQRKWKCINYFLSQSIFTEILT